MIDICTVVYKNYDLLDLQIKHWKRLGEEGKDYRLLVVDNTPGALRDKSRNIAHVTDYGGSDGESHGAALDYLIKQARTPIVGIVDTDFFWLKSDILRHVEHWYFTGFQCIGAAGFYPDWQRVLDPRHPDRAGHLAPVCWGMFVDRKLALEQTFVSTAAEGAQIHETGWRLRKRLIDEDIPRIVFDGFYPQGWTDHECCFFTHNTKNVGVHFLKGSGGRQHLTNNLPTILDNYFA